MQLISKYNQEIKFLLCVTDIYRNYVWIVVLKDKKGETILTAFKSIMESQKKQQKNPNLINSLENQINSKLIKFLHYLIHQ